MRIRKVGRAKGLVVGNSSANLSSPPEEYKKLGATRAEVLVRKACALALAGDLRAMREIMQRSDVATATEPDLTQSQRKLGSDLQHAK